MNFENCKFFTFSFYYGAKSNKKPRSLVIVIGAVFLDRVNDAAYRAYSAAIPMVAATRQAANLNSGILPNGSTTGLVKIFAAAST